MTEEKILFLSTVWGEAANSSRAAQIAVAVTIKNRLGYREWRHHKTLVDIITKTGFDAATIKNSPFREMFTALSAKNLEVTHKEEYYRDYLLVIGEVYEEYVPPPSGGMVLYYSPRAQSRLSRTSPQKYREKPPWDFKLLSQVYNLGLSRTDDFIFFEYKKGV